MLFKVISLIIFKIYVTSAALFIWSNHEVIISPLEEFSTKDFLNIVDSFEKPDVYIFTSPKPISRDIMTVVTGFYSMYSPSGDISIDNIIDLTGNPDKDLKIIKDTIGESKNFIATVIIPNNETINRSKRDLNDDIDGDIENKPTDNSLLSSTPPKESVIYRASRKSKTNEETYALLYSSGSLIFRKNESNSSEIYLGNVEDDMIIYDTRLNINIPNGRGKITLRFNFTWQSGYWYMPSVKITDTESKADYNLLTKTEIVAPGRFSYHCNGDIKFADSNGVELIIFDLQVQPDSRNGKFGDANDCVSFTTAPICSGIFITILLGIGMVIALTSIMDIKTMDKFDNYKTKNLAITVSD